MINNFVFIKYYYLVLELKYVHIDILNNYQYYKGILKIFLMLRIAVFRSNITFYIYTNSLIILNVHHLYVF